MRKSAGSCGGVGDRSFSKERDSDLGQSTLARALNPQGRSHLSSSSKVGRHRESHSLP